MWHSGLLVLALSFTGLASSVLASGLEKRDDDPVDWATVDYAGVDWATIDYTALDYSTVDYSTVKYSTIDRSTHVDWSTVKYSATSQSNGIAPIMTTLSETSFIQPNPLSLMTFTDVPDGQTSLTTAIPIGPISLVVPLPPKNTVIPLAPFSSPATVTAAPAGSMTHAVPKVSAATPGSSQLSQVAYSTLAYLNSSQVAYSSQVALSTPSQATYSSQVTGSSAVPLPAPSQVTGGGSTTSSKIYPDSWTFTLPDGSTTVDPFPTQTATITSLPDISTQLTTNSLWLSNFVTTTTIGGHPSVVPVLVNPKTHGGIIVYGLPYPPPWNQVISLPGLPDISWPCVPIPLIHSCGGGPAPPPGSAPPDPLPPADTPPTVFGPDAPGDDPQPTDKPRVSSLESSATTPSRSSSSSLTLGSSSASTSSSITPSSSTLSSSTSSPSRSTSSSSASSSQECTSATAFGRRAEPTGSPECPLPEGVWQDYIIVPNYDQGNYADQQAFTTTLQNELGSNFTSAQEVAALETVFFWLATMNSSQLEKYSNNPVVNYTMLREVSGETFTWNSMKKRDWIEIPKMDDEGTELTVISQALGQPLRDQYVLDSTMGAGSKVYILDSGCDPNHVTFQFQNLNDPSNWIFPQGLGTYESNGQQVPYINSDLVDLEYHGTSMASKVAGIGFGVAPAAQLIIVKSFSEETENQHPDSGFAWTLSSLIGILNRVVADDTGKKTTILSAGGLGSPEDTDRYLQGPYIQLYQALFNYGVSVVVAAGNNALGANGYAPTSDLDEWPALLSVYTSLPFIVVGGTGTDFNIWPHTQGVADGRITLYSPADALVAYTTSGVDGVASSSGTSNAAAAVAGLVAYFQGLPSLQATMAAQSDRIFSYWMYSYLKTSGSYPRVVGGPNILYNGAPSSACMAPGFGKRQDNSASYCEIDSTTISVSLESTAISSLQSLPTTFKTSVSSVSSSTAVGPEPSTAPTRKPSPASIPPSPPTRSSSVASVSSSTSVGPKPSPAPTTKPSLASTSPSSSARSSSSAASPSSMSIGPKPSPVPTSKSSPTPISPSPPSKSSAVPETTSTGSIWHIGFWAPQFLPGTCYNKGSNCSVDLAIFPSSTTIPDFCTDKPGLVALDVAPWPLYPGKWWGSDLNITDSFGTYRECMWTIQRWGDPGNLTCQEPGNWPEGNVVECLTDRAEQIDCTGPGEYGKYWIPYANCFPPPN